MSAVSGLPVQYQYTAQGSPTVLPDGFQVNRGGAGGSRPSGSGSRIGQPGGSMVQLSFAMKGHFNWVCSGDVLYFLVPAHISISHARDTSRRCLVTALADKIIELGLAWLVSQLVSGSHTFALFKRAFELQLTQSLVSYTQLMFCTCHVATRVRRRYFPPECRHYATAARRACIDGIC
jgi:hypothetical protein